MHHNCYLRVMSSLTWSYLCLSWWLGWSQSKFRFIEQIFRTHSVQTSAWQIYNDNLHMTRLILQEPFLNSGTVWSLSLVTDLFWHEVLSLCSFYGNISAYLLILKSSCLLTKDMIVLLWLGLEKTVFSSIYVMNYSS